MISKSLTRLGYYLSLFLGIIFLSFLLFHAIPDDPARTILGPNASEGQVAELRTDLGLDQPVHIQLKNYIWQAVTFNFGNSFVDQRSVASEVLTRFSVSMVLFGQTVLIILLYLAFVLLSSQSSTLRKFISVSDFLFSSQPIFFSGIVVALITLYYYPFVTFSGEFRSVEDFMSLLPAALVTALYPMAILSGILRDQLKLSFQSQYIRAAKAMGIPELVILCKYALKNCLLPVLAAFSNILPSLLTGAFIVEIIFSLPGIGTLLLNSILMRDLPMLECTIILNGAFFILINYVFEILYPLVDSRIGENDDAPV